MKHICIWLLLICLGISAHTKGQEVINFDSCEFNKYFTDCETPPEVVGGNEALLDYFIKNVGKDIPTEPGQMMIHVYIDSEGKPCCKRLYNSSAINLRSLDFRKIINSMPVWKPGIQNRHFVNCLETIYLLFGKNGLQVKYNIGTQ